MKFWIVFADPCHWSQRSGRLHQDCCYCLHCCRLATSFPAQSLSSHPSLYLRPESDLPGLPVYGWSSSFHSLHSLGPEATRMKRNMKQPNLCGSLILDSKVSLTWLMFVHSISKFRLGSRPSNAVPRQSS